MIAMVAVLTPDKQFVFRIDLDDGYHNRNVFHEAVVGGLMKFRPDERRMKWER